MADFSSTFDANDNVTLVLDDIPIVVSKSYLAMHSPVFCAMFFKGNFVENKSKQVPLKGVNYIDFVEALKLIFPCDDKYIVQEYNVKNLLVVGDQFEMKMVMKKCEIFLTWLCSFDVNKKLIYAERFGLYDLREECCKGVVYDLEKLMADPEFEELNSDQKMKVVDFVVRNGIRCKRCSP